jgi:hypothetical protein
MRKALSIAAGAWSETSWPKKLLISRLKLISPRLIVTGSISSRPAAPRVTPVEAELELEGRVAQVQVGISNWTRVPARIAIA